LVIIKYKLETIEKLNRAIADYYGYCDCDCRRRITIAGQKRLRNKTRIWLLRITGRSERTESRYWTLNQHRFTCKVHPFLFDLLLTATEDQDST
ncbi:AAEL001669-PA, partial [Aedes aegypti]